MSKKCVFRVLALACVALLSVTGAFAGNAYVGASAGSGGYDVSGFDSSGTSFKVLGGYRVMKFFGVEGDYRDFGGPSASVAGQSFSVDTTTIDLFAVGVIPVGGKFEIFGKAGYAMWDVKVDVGGLGSVGTDGNDLAYGAGVAWHFTKFAVRLEYEMFDIENTVNVDMASVGMEFRF